jgi:hypothetical protein
VAVLAITAGVFAACASDPAPAPASEGDGGDEGWGGWGGDPSTTTTTGSGGDELPCPYLGEALVDPSGLTPCPSTMCGGGAHCVPTSLVPAEQQASLADCDAESKCVPDPFIATKGNFIPATCSSFMGAEGRCVSTCLPAVQEQLAMLPQDICAQHEICAPCFDPLSGEETGACTLSCDPGPVSEGPVPLPGCCNDKATCVPTAAIPDDQEDKLAPSGCPTGDGGDGAPAMLCVPDEMLDPAWQPSIHCETSELIQWTYGEEYWEGGCLPACLGAVQQPGITQSDCPPDYRCVPCWDPESYGQLTGACPWKGSN